MNPRDPAPTIYAKMFDAANKPLELCMLMAIVGKYSMPEDQESIHWTEHSLDK